MYSIIGETHRSNHSGLVQAHPNNCDRSQKACIINIPSDSLQWTSVHVHHLYLLYHNPYSTIVYNTPPWCTLSYSTILYHSLQYSAMVYSVILYHTLLCYGSTIFCYGSHILYHGSTIPYHGSTIFYHGSTSISWLILRGQLNPGGNSRVLPLVSRHLWHCCLDSEPWHCWTNELVCSGYSGWPGLHWAQWWAWLAGKVHVQPWSVFVCGFNC